MHRRLASSLPLLLSLAAGTAAAQAPPQAEGEAQAAFADPGPRWTGRWIVHVKRDAAVHESVMKQLGALRRADDTQGIQALVHDYERTVEVGHLPVIDRAIGGGAVVLETNWLSGTVVLANAGSELLEALDARADVRLVQPDTWAEAQMEVATDAAHHNSDFANTLLTPAGANIDGSGVTVAIIDSGIDADHAGSSRPHATFFPGGNPANPTGPGIAGSRIVSSETVAAFTSQSDEDTFGHGTRMASIAAGAKFNSLPDIDDAPAFGATIRSLKISDDFIGGGLASTVSMNNAFQQILLYPDVVVANMSYDGTQDPVASPNQTIESATLADVFVTLSAGNYGTDLGFAHAAFNALVVGAADVQTKEPLVLPGSVISAIGPLADGRTYPQLIAVGEALTCADMDDEAGSIDSFGTSGAAALTAGSAALIRQANPSLTQLQVKALLLNTSEEVVLGNPDAAGFGYLRTDRAVEAALAGDVVQETITTGVVKKHVRFFPAGEDATLTLVWNRESSGELTIDDLDLRVRDPFGNLIAWSASTVDNIEQIRLEAVEGGIYEVEVVPIKFDGDGMAEYALAGVDTMSIDPSSCTPGPPILLQQSPPGVPALTQAMGPPLVNPEPVNTVTLIGCNFSGAAVVQVGSKFIPTKVIDDNTLTFDLGIAEQLGSVPLTIINGSGVLSDFLNVVPADNVLATSPTIDLGTLFLNIGGQPGDFYAVAFSPELIPTEIPGLLSVDIGNAAASLFPLLFGNLNTANGVEEFVFNGIPGITGTLFHFQGVTLDAATLALPWRSTNVGSVFYF
ncbi:MAG: S8 family serine peptidase [Planctomycetota bacterium]